MTPSPTPTGIAYYRQIPSDPTTKVAVDENGKCIIAFNDLSDYDESESALTNLDNCNALFYNVNGQDAAEEPMSLPWYSHREEVAGWGVRPVWGGKGWEESEFIIDGTHYVYPRNGSVTPSIEDYSAEP